jgi:TusA-related sulfurtransferase
MVAPVSPAEQFAAALRALDFDALAETLHPSARLRALIPSGVRIEEGRDAVAGVFRGWFGRATEHETLSSGVEPLAGRTRVTYRFRTRIDGARWTIEQSAYCDGRDGALWRIDLVCTGFRPLVEAGADGTFRFEAGSLACSDGLEETFKRALRTVPVGGRLVVHSTDPSVRVELPAFARLLGHEVGPVEIGPGGTLVAVERRS